MDVISVQAGFASFKEYWRQKVVARLNGQEIKLVKVRGTFPWHTHADADELFLVWRGYFRVEYRERVVEAGAGEMIMVPRGAEHRTAAEEEAEVVIFDQPRSATPATSWMRFSPLLRASACRGQLQASRTH